MMEEPLPEGDFADVLQNGVILCKLMNKIEAGSVKKFKEKVFAFDLHQYPSDRVLCFSFCSVSQ